MIILHINTRKVIAVTPGGPNPNYIAITPDSQYALGPESVFR